MGNSYLYLGLGIGLSKPLLDVTGNGEKNLLHVEVRLGTSFEKLDAIFISQSLPLRCRYSPLTLIHISLVANQDLVDIVRGMLLNVPDPVPYVCVSDAKINEGKRKSIIMEALGEMQARRKYC
jgi:hypothetical protein